jgi:alkylhydroperoxidase family enzyme
MLSSAVVQAVLDDWRTAPISEKLRAMLGFLEKLTLAPGEVGPDDAIPLRALGIGEQAAEDAMMVCTLFNIIDRIADSLNFAVPTPEDFARTASNAVTHSYAPIE